MKEELGLILRTKGFMWFPTANDFILNWSTAGAFGEIDVGGKFFCAVPKEEWPDDEETRKIIQDAFSDDPAIGDRRQEIVFIGQVWCYLPLGHIYQEPLVLAKSLRCCLFCPPFFFVQDLNAKAIKDLLDSCLATDEELKNVEELEDPLGLAELAANL